MDLSNLPPKVRQQLETYLEHFMNDVAPKIDNSAVGLSIVEGKMGSPEQYMEMGYLVMKDKPIMLLRVPGQKISKKLASIADEIIDFDPDMPFAEQPEVSRKIQAFHQRYARA